ncbi:MAG: hypothetical protein M3N38_02630 [Pseudomonadota bacterium]|nr:hypothetical protein [Pseudomonadota bacterium]
MAIAIVGLLVVAGPGSEPMVQAAKEPPVVKALLDKLAVQFGSRPTYKRLKKAKDGTITIRSLTTEPTAPAGAALNPKTVLSIGEVTLRGIEARPDGVFDITEAKLSSVLLISDDGTDVTGAFRAPEVVYEHYYVAPVSPAPAASERLLALGNLAGKTAIKGGVLSFGGLSLHIGAWQSTWVGEPLSGAGNYTLRIEGIRLPATIVSRIDPNGHLEELVGGGDLVFDFTASGVGKIINDVHGGAIEGTITLESLGTLRFSAGFDGVSEALRAQFKSPSLPRWRTLEPLLASVTINGVSARFEDLSLTRKLMSLFTTQRGLDEPAMIATAASAVQFSKNDLRMQIFNERLNAAVREFLADPKSLSIRSQPAEPIKLGKLLLSLGNDPGAVVEVVNPTIWVNN